MNKKRLAIILLFLVAILFITAGIMITTTKTNVKKEYKDIKWNRVYGDPIPTDYEKYASFEFKNYSFNLDTNEQQKSFEINLPKEIVLESFDTNVIRYNIEDISLIVTRTNTTNLKEEAETIKLNNDPIYEKIYIETAEYDKDLFAIILEAAKYNGDRTSMIFLQEVKIYTRVSDMDFAVINFKTIEKRIDKEMLSKIINSVQIKNKSINFCNKNKCEAKLNKLHESLNHNFSLKIDKNKYVFDYNQGLSGTNATYITKEYAESGNNEDDAIAKLTTINIRLVYSKDSYLYNSDNLEEIKIGGKTVLKEYEENDIGGITQYKGTYIYEKDDNVSVIISIDSRLDNVEKVAKDFLNFELN